MIHARYEHSSFEFNIIKILRKAQIKYQPGISLLPHSKNSNQKNKKEKKRKERKKMVESKQHGGNNMPEI